MKFRKFILALALVILSTAAQAATPPKEELARVESYLNGINTLVSPFTQVDSQGDVTKGTFYLERPGKLRWEYSPPYPILIIAKGSLLTYYDKELDEVSHVSLEDNLSGFLTRKNISFADESIEILNFAKEKGYTSITIAQKEKPEDGQLTLVFDDKKPELARMEMLDSIGKKTIVTFNSIVYDRPIDKNMFILSRPKKGK